MRILHLNTWDYVGGAAKGVHALHKKLISLGIDSTLLVQYKTLEDDSIVQIYEKDERTIRENFDSLPVRFYGVHPFTLSSSLIDSRKLLDKIEELDPDIVHLHWICRSFLSIEDIAKIKQPIVWTLRDWWAMSGGCHHPLDCKSYQNECGKCHLIKSESDYDITHQNLQRKIKYFTKEKMTIVGISQHMANDAKSSSLFKNFDVRLIYNSIDDDLFYKVSSAESQKRLNIQTRKKIISIGANSLNDKHKGLDYFLQALRLINIENVLIIFFGETNSGLLQKLNCEYLDFGYIEDKDILRDIYGASDLFVAPSLFEPFGKTIAEAMACGTPVVCFENAGGPSEIVTHKLNGYVAKKYDFKDIALGIEWILYNENYEKLSNYASESALSRFSAAKIAHKYIDLYIEKKDSSKIYHEFNSCNQSLYLNKLSMFSSLSKRLNAALPHNKTYIIYGYGYLGMYLESILSNREIIFADKDLNKVNGINIISPTEVGLFNFEKIIISVIKRSEAIIDYLKELKVPSDKIIDINTMMFK